MAEDAPAPTPQLVLSPLTSAAIFLVATIDPGGEAVTRDVLSQVSSLQRAVGFRAEPDGRLSCVTGIGSQAWDRLFTGSRPAQLHPFRALEGPVHRAVSTPGDLLFHIRAARLDLCFALATEIMARLGGAVTARDEVHGFQYLAKRALLGFVDGTENPTGPGASAAVLVGDEDPEFAGGSYVIVQKYVHDLDAWNALPVETQEKIIGRTKLNDIELDDDVKPADSHIALCFSKGIARILGRVTSLGSWTPGTPIVISSCPTLSFRVPCRRSQIVSPLDQLESVSFRTVE